MAASKPTSRCPFAYLLFLIISLIKISIANGIEFVAFTQKQPANFIPAKISTQYQEQRQQLNTYNMSFEPESIEEMIEKTEQVVFFTLNTTTNLTGLALTIIPDDTLVAEISENSTIELGTGGNYQIEEFALTAADTQEQAYYELRQPKKGTLFHNPDDFDATSFIGSFRVRGKRLGRTNLLFYLHPVEQTWQQSGQKIYDSYEVIVLREYRRIDDIYRNGIIIFASLIYLGFGCQIDLAWMWSIIKRPVAPTIGACCQFLVMPLLGFGVAMMFNLDDEYAFGLLAMSCSPGGGGSNVYAFLLRGDLDLSICMTCISTILACVFMPFWMWALGRFFIDETRVVIPYGTIMRSLATIVLPLLVGLAIRRYIKKLAAILVKVTTPLSMIFVLYMLTFGMYVNWYMFVIMVTVPEIIPASLLVPTFGFLAGYFIAYALKQGNVKATTISVETGYQNASIPIIMLQGNFPQPEGDLGAVMPVATAYFMQIPIYAWYFALEIRDRCCKVKIDDQSAVKDLDEGTKEIAITTVSEEVEMSPETVREKQQKAENKNNTYSISARSYMTLERN